MAQEPIRRGQRVAVAWSSTRADSEYSGTVVDTTWVFGVRSRLVLAYKVRYDDGDVQWHHHGREPCRLLPPSRQHADGDEAEAEAPDTGARTRMRRVAPS